ncbi:MAG: lamin tail domain-containing protein [Clostridiales bacterium]|nr:lamin tail domain-containing protein [Clostridiales bacterium]
MLKKITIIGMVLLLAFSGITITATEPELPDLIITEIVADNASSDVFEYIEIFNASGRTIDLYDYSIAYVADLTSASYNGPNKKTELVSGNFSTSLVDRSRAFDNPSEFLLSPGDVVLIWFWNFDSYEARATISDFRAYYDLSDDVRVVAIDADNSAATGNPDRFNLQNSGYRGICIVESNFTPNSGYDDVISMATLDYGKIQPSMPDLAVVYGKPVKAEEKWRLNMTAFWIEPTPGYLTEAQKLEFDVGAGSTDSNTAAPTFDKLPKVIFTILCVSAALVFVFSSKRRIER